MSEPLTRNELAEKIARALADDPAFVSIEVLDPTGEYGNEGVLSVEYGDGDEGVVYYTIQGPE